MKVLNKILCLIVLLCFSTSGFSETANLWVGESWTFEPAPLMTYLSEHDYYTNFEHTWTYDQTYFSVVLSDSDNDSSTEKNNVATVTLKHIFNGTKEIKCTYFYRRFGESIYKTVTYYVVCNKVGITIYPTSLTMDIGDTQTLQYQFSPINSNPAAEVAFSSSNPSVVMVDLYGKITAKSAGTATVAATTNYWTTAICEVTVNPMLATSISLNKASVSLPVGSTQTLTATVLPADATDKSVTWTTSDENIATVDTNGNVTAVSKGIATITATTNDGTDLSASCAVTVTAVQPTGITLSQEEVEMRVGEQLKLTASILPAEASQRVTWSSSDPAIARVVGGTVYALEWGECVITAKAIDNSALTSNCLIYVLPEQQQGGGCDVNGSGIVDVDDVNEVINYILTH